MKEEQDAIKKSQGNKRQFLEVKNTIAEMVNSFTRRVGKESCRHILESRTKRQK